MNGRGCWRERLKDGRHDVIRAEKPGASRVSACGNAVWPHFDHIEIKEASHGFKFELW